MQRLIEKVPALAGKCPGRLNGHTINSHTNESPPLWKRSLDITCILIALPFLIPLAIGIGVVIKCVSRGPIIFLQERVGYRGRRFICFKFRTMKVGSNAQSHQSHVTELMRSNLPMTKLDTKGDQRLIPLGSLLRATGLDELPQILNVLGGQMSLVGPRPCLGYEYENYSLWQRQRFNTLPGLTGLWQVSGKNKTTFSEMIALDIVYTERKSPWLDLLILMKTPLVVVSQLREARMRWRPVPRCSSEATGEGGEERPRPRCHHDRERLRASATSADPSFRSRRQQKLLKSLFGSLLLGCFAFSPEPVSGAAPGYLLSEGFEGTGYENAGWSPAISTTAPDPDYTAPALVGSHSLRCNGASFIQRPFVRSDLFYCYFRVRWQSWSDYKYVVDWLDTNQSSTATLFTSFGNKLEIRHGSVSVPGTTVISLNTTYHVWLEWTRGTGSDGTLKLFVSLDGTRPASPEATISTGTGAALAFFDVGPFGAGTDAIYDQILIDDEVIGSNPGEPGGNSPPTISHIDSQTTPRNTPVGPIAFSVGDAETSPADLVVTAASSNPGLVPDSNIVMGGSGSDRTVTITPATDQIGLATITVTVSDGQLTRSAAFELTVTAPGGAPTYLLSEGFEGSGFENSGWFEMGTPNEDYAAEALHGSQSLHCLGGQSIYRIFQNSNSFGLYFRARWNSRTEANTLLYFEDAAFGLVAYVQAADNFFRIVHGAGFDAASVPIAERVTYHLWLEWTRGTGHDGTMKLFVSTNGNKPSAPVASLANGTGKATERMYIGATGGSGLDLVLDRILIDDVPIGSITDANQPPVISDIHDQVVAQNASTDAIPFTIGDAETAATSLSLSASSSNPTLVPNGNILFGGAGPDRTVTVTPAPNQSGTAIVTVVVSDGTLTASDSFSLTVGQGNERTVLTVTVDSATRVYGAANPDFTGNLTGLRNGDNIIVTYVSVAIAASPVGSYPIRPVLSDPDGKLGNYTVVTNVGTLTVTPAALDVSADNKSRGYGAGNPPLTGTITGARNGDNLTATYSTMASSASAVGIYTIAPVLSDPDGRLSNYTVAVHNGTLTVTPAPLSISAHDKTRAFAAENPPLTGSVIGIQNNDAITASYTTTATLISLPGNYPITPTPNDPNNKLGNYRVTTRNGTLTVTLLPTVIAASLPLLEVSADDKTRVYGSANPVLTGTITGLRNGDNITATYTTVANRTSAVGVYAIAPVLQDPSGKLLNYTLSVRNGTLTVKPGGSIRMASLSSPGDRVHIAGTGDANVIYTIQASADLIQWTDIGSAAADSDGRFEFDEVGRSDPGCRFYRARLRVE